MSANPSSRTAYERLSSPPPMRFQPRDSKILNTIFRYDGVLARRHLKSLFWPTASQQAMEQRISLLFHNGYLNWPNAEQRRTKPIPEPIVWLDWKGILHISGNVVKPPNSDRENQLRLLERKLRNQHIRWQREPRWSQLFHDLAVVDFRMAVEAAVEEWPAIGIETWVNEGEFLSDMDTITFSYKDKDGRSKRRKKGIRPDSFFVIADHLRARNGSAHKARFLLELDNSNHSLQRFGRDKVIPGLEYIHSKAYRQRFGYNSGRWLIVCQGDLRLQHMKQMTETIAGRRASLFYFATLDQITPQTILAEPIWHRGNRKEPTALLPVHRKISQRSLTVE